VNHSVADFSVDATDPARATVRFGLTAIKGIGDGPVGAIVEARNEGGPFADIYDFCERVDIARCQKSAVEAIIKAGGFDSLHPNRRATLAALEDAFAAAQRARKEKASGQVALFDALMVSESAAPPRPLLPSVPEFERGEKLAHEKELLGLYLSGHPFLAYKERVARFNAISSEELREKGDKEDVVVAGIVAGLRKVITRSSKAEMCIVTIEDMQGKAAVTLFPRTWEKYRDTLQTDQAIVVKGKSNHRERVRATEEGDSTDVEVLGDEVLVLDGNDTATFQNGNGNGKSNGNGHAAHTYQRLRLDLTDVPSATIGTVKTLLKHYPGESPVIVEKRGHRVHSVLKVRATEEVRQVLAPLLPPNAVKLE
jgi:DNA polymerase-3 subunit alpha